ncbi:MAG TPA: cellulase family glycosylhydrolase [Parafilimonas sp.]|nr:cellulase family glycosylhydrolase [Parafilimonas sp.]
MKKYFLSLLVIVIAASCGQQQNKQKDSATEPVKEREVWTKEQANTWYADYGWLCGSDFIPSSAINQLEMWQAQTFDTATINRELGYAESIGLNIMRVYLHHLAWQVDSSGFKDRVSTYLSIADKHNIKTIFVFFDDCWNPTYKSGTQPAPKPGIHNSGWVRDPGQLLYDSSAITTTLEAYVKDVLNTFRDDKRIFLWDLYNEPGNSDYGNKSMTLLKNVFTWARTVNPAQPLSAGVWNSELHDLNAYQLANSDVITYHDYNPVEVHQKTIDTLKKYGKPLICTEYMARTRNSTFSTITPMLKANKIVAINWGLVAGKTNTMYAWDTPMPNGKEPKVWFHDIFRKNGAPYSKDEVVLIKSLTGTK